MKATWIGYGKRFLQALRRAAPVILFFLTGFASVYALFGMQYVCVVSVVTVFFQMRHKKNDKTPRRYLRLLVTGTFLMICAYVSTLSLVSCLLLNLLIPFVLVFTQSSQFNPKGYFSYAMIFVFLSLMPPDHLGELAVEIVVFFFCVGLLAVSIRLYTRLFSPPASVPFTLEKGLSALADMVRLLPDEERRPELEQRFSKLEQEFHRQSYHQNFFRRQNPENGRQDMFSTMMQRFSYLLTDNSWRNELQEDQIRTLRETVALMEETAKRLEFLSHKELTETCQKALKRMTIEEGRIRIFCRSMLHQLRVRSSAETFEMRFAMRLALVMTVSSGLSYVLPFTRSYWIPLNAFFLLQPSYEDSSYRMKTRTIGTFLGCCVEFVVHPLLPGVTGQVLFSLVMISLMYCSVPGTWYQPIFTTCYALTMASMTMRGTDAILLRILYLCAAVVIVFAANRFFFPTRRETQFKHNFKTLFRLNNSYWDIIRQGLEGETNLSVSGEILTHFHMIAQDCARYLREQKEEPCREERQAVLLKLWHMFAELEQMHFLIRTKSVRPEEQKRLLHMIEAIQEELYPVISGENLPVIRRELQYQDPEVVYVLDQYLRHAESLLAYQSCIPF